MTLVSSRMRPVLSNLCVLTRMFSVQHTELLQQTQHCHNFSFLWRTQTLQTFNKGLANCPRSGCLYQSPSLYNNQQVWSHRNGQCKTALSSYSTSSKDEVLVRTQTIQRLNKGLANSLRSGTLYLHQTPSLNNNMHSWNHKVGQYRTALRSYSTSSKDEVKEMTDEEKQLYKAVKSEMDSSPIDIKEIDSKVSLPNEDTTRKKTPKKGKKKSEKFKEKMEEDLNFPNVTVYSVGSLDLASLQKEFENDDLYIVCQLPPEFRKEVLMVRSRSKKQDGTYTDAFFFRSYGVACWAMNQHQGEELVMKAIRNKQGTRYQKVFRSLQDILDNREVFRTVQAETIKRTQDKIHIPSVTDESLQDQKVSMDLALKKYSFSKAMLQSVTLGIFEEMLDNFIENRGLEQRTEELKLGVGSAMTSKNVYTGFGEISYIRYQTNLSDLFDGDPDELWEYDNLDILYKDMVAYLSIPNRLRELNRNLDYCQDLIKLFNDRLTDKHHVMLERIIIVLIFIEILIELIRIAVPYVMPRVMEVAGIPADKQTAIDER